MPHHLNQLDSNSQQSIETLPAEEEGVSGRRNSWLSNHYSQNMDDSGEPYRICIFRGCGKKYSKNTSHIILKGHWVREHGEKPEQKQITRIFCQEEHLDNLVRYIITDEQTFSISESKSHRRYSASLNRSKRFTTRRYISASIISGLDKMIEMAKERLDSVHSVALTFDIWSSQKSGKTFACLTGHYIDLVWGIKSLIVDFGDINYPHDSQAISKFITDAIIFMGIRDKIVSITSDNASNNIAGFDLMRWYDSRANIGDNFPFEFTHYRCIAHVINLGVKEALDELELLLIPVRRIVRAIKGHNSRVRGFNIIQLNVNPNKKPLAIINEIDTRWNSTYMMLNRVLKLKVAIQDALTNMHELKGLSEPDWNLLGEVCTFLEPFNEMTEAVSGDTYPTVGLVNLFIPLLIKHVNKQYENLYLNRAAMAFKLKFEEYHSYYDSEPIMMASLLDPRVKTSFLPADRHKFAEETLRKYINREENSQTQTTTISKLKYFNQAFDQVKDEPSAYLSLSREPMKTDPLNYWSKQAENFPELSSLARKLLPIQATSVASERVFSRVSLIDTPHRNRLLPKNLSACIKARSYLKYLDLDEIDTTTTDSEED